MALFSWRRKAAIGQPALPDPAVIAAQAEASTRAAEEERRAQAEQRQREKADAIAANDRHPVTGSSVIEFVPNSFLTLANTANIWYVDGSQELQLGNGIYDPHISREKFETIASVALAYGDKLMNGRGSSWHRIGDELVNLGALRWFIYDGSDRMKFDNGQITGITRERFEQMAKDYTAYGALPTGGRVSSVIRAGDELVNLNTVGTLWHKDGALKAANYHLAMDAQQWDKTQKRLRLYNRAMDFTEARRQTVTRYIREPLAPSARNSASRDYGVSSAYPHSSSDDGGTANILLATVVGITLIEGMSAANTSMSTGPSFSG